MSQDTLRELAVLCAQLRDADLSVEKAERELKERKALVRRLEEEDIPGLMSELGVESITLETGERIKIALEIYASITEAMKERAFKWLEDNGHGGLIKTEVSVRFGRDAVAQATALTERLVAEGLEPDVVRAVAPQTLKAFLKERIEANSEVPMEVFGARPVKVAKIKQP